MSEERKERIKIISDQFKKEIIKLSHRTDKEIQQMVDDCLLSFESNYKRKPDLFKHLMFYDHLIISLIQNLFVIRDVKRHDILKKMRKTE